MSRLLAAVRDLADKQLEQSKCCTLMYHDATSTSDRLMYAQMASVNRSAYSDLMVIIANAEKHGEG